MLVDVNAFNLGYRVLLIAAVKTAAMQMVLGHHLANTVVQQGSKDHMRCKLYEGSKGSQGSQESQGKGSQGSQESQGSQGIDIIISMVRGTKGVRGSLYSFILQLYNMTSQFNPFLPTGLEDMMKQSVTSRGRFL